MRNILSSLDHPVVFMGATLLATLYAPRPVECALNGVLGYLATKRLVHPPSVAVTWVKWKSCSQAVKNLVCGFNPEASGRIAAIKRRFKEEHRTGFAAFRKMDRFSVIPIGAAAAGGAVLGTFFKGIRAFSILLGCYIAAIEAGRKAYLAVIRTEQENAVYPCFTSSG